MKIETAVARNRKFVQAGPAPSWLWLCGNAYCKESLTDGFIPFEALTFLGVKNAKQMVPHLVRANLWEVKEGGWQVHDYLEHNAPADDIKHHNAKRAANGGLGGRPPKPRNKSLGLPEKSREERERVEQIEESAEPQSGTTPAVLVFPVVGVGSKSWTLTSQQIADWETAFPGIDVLGECRKALAWVRAKQRKTARGMPAFLVRWLNRAVDSGRGQSRALAVSTADTWLEQCRASGHNPKCNSHDQHLLRNAVAARGCSHPGVCQSLGQHHKKLEAEALAEKRKREAS